MPGSGTYSTSLTISPWSGVSGGYVHQLNFNNGGVYYRTGVFNANWDNWRKLVMEDGNGNISIGSSNPNSKLWIYGGDIGFHQNNTLTNGIIWKNGGYQKTSAAIKPVDLSSYARQGLGFFTGDFSDNTTDMVERMRITRAGKVGIGTITPDYLLTVAGTISAREVKVEANAGGADFVFDDDYPLRPLSEVDVS